jgi:type IV pilus assembly protein PilB
LSTLHTRNACGAIPRLKILGIDQDSLESCLLSVSSQRLVRKTCQQCIKLGVSAKDQCPNCKGSGYYGRIGVHEVLSKTHLFHPSTLSISMQEAGLAHVKAGLINQAALDAEVGSWH